MRTSELPGTRYSIYPVWKEVVIITRFMLTPGRQLPPQLPAELSFFILIFETELLHDPRESERAVALGFGTPKIRSIKFQLLHFTLE